MGSLDRAPFIKLDKDDRSGTSSDGENLFINGNKWHEIKRVLVYAFIYEGSPNWSEANAVITIKNSDQADIIVNLDNHDSRNIMCGIAMLENVNDQVQITKLVEYFNGHEKLDRAYQFGLHWSPGRK